ncbi:MAG: FHA domain-containing protein [Verrucomicrobiota bacterium]|jgi:hypothetical protein
MVRLRMEGSPHGLQEILLKPGLNRLGRVEDNDYQVRDDSISSHHCQIELKDGVITVWDLNSTNGTFIDGQPIQQAVLHPGQVLCLGTVPMICQDDSVMAPAANSAGMPSGAGRDSLAANPGGIPVAVNTDVCSQHPQAAARWCCVKCGGAFCTACVRTTRVGGQFFRACPKCGGSCVSVTEYKRLLMPVPDNFFALWREAFSYPLKKDGAILLVCGTVVFSFLDGGRMILSHFRYAGSIGIAYWLCLIMSVGYLFAFMQNIVQASSQGEEKMPDWPEISGFWDDLVVPFFQFGVIWFLCLGPGFAVQLFVSPLAGVPLLLLGLFCLPMAILTVCLADSIAGLNPIIIFSGIGKVPLPYLAICGIFLAIIALMHGSQMLLDLTGIPMLPTIISAFISLYGITVEMRLLGLLYLTNKSKLAWFE